LSPDPSSARDDRFPDGFLWGAATSAYQIEGSPLADGAGPSIWYRWSHTPGRTIGGPLGDVACDHYRRWESDLELMRELGLGSYRMSIAWSRVLPEGRGRVNNAGLDFYRRLIDRLLEHGIAPNVTLYHWDLPAALDDRGGWLNPDIVSWFADYATVLFEALADRVPMWATLNEPWVITHDGYLSGCNAPGHRNLFEVPIAAHHTLLAHGAAVERYRDVGRQRIGLVVNLAPKDAATDTPADRDAAKRADTYFNKQFLDPALLGRWPVGISEIYGEAWPRWPDTDLRRINQPIDFLGINYYTRNVVRDDAETLPDRAAHVPQPGEHMTTGWEVYPEGLVRTLCDVKTRYGDVPLYVTENGSSFPDPPTVTGETLDDPSRTAYLRSHLAACREAIARGVSLRGYYAWSFMDNIEWSSGIRHRFGLVHVDFATQKRTLKTSGRLYRELIRTNGATLNAAL
jgi:beta-glucosidase